MPDITSLNIPEAICEALSAEEIYKYFLEPLRFTIEELFELAQCGLRWEEAVRIALSQLRDVYSFPDYVSEEQCRQANIWDEWDKLQCFYCYNSNFLADTEWFLYKCCDSSVIQLFCEECWFRDRHRVENNMLDVDLIVKSVDCGCPVYQINNYLYKLPRHNSVLDKSIFLKKTASGLFMDYNKYFN